MKKQLFQVFASVHARMIICVLSIFVGFTLTASAQTLIPKQNEKDGKWGLVDSVKNKWVVKPKFDKINPYITHGGKTYIPVEIINSSGNVLKGMFTREGKEVAECKYKEIFLSTKNPGSGTFINPYDDFFLLITYKNTLDIYSPKLDFTRKPDNMHASATINVKITNMGDILKVNCFPLELDVSTAHPDWEKMKSVGLAASRYHGRGNFYFDKDGNELTEAEALNLVASKKFTNDWANFMQVAVAVADSNASPYACADLVPVYQKINTKQFGRHKEIVKLGLDMLCDSVFFFIRKPTNKAQIQCFTIFQDLYLDLTIWDYQEDYVPKNRDLDFWASSDVLRKDIEKSAHREEYQRILEIIERGLQGNLESITGHVPYYMTMQLTSLCGLGRWKEAASYFPKVHRAVTENGRYDVPYALSYIQRVLNEQGYNVTAPNYKTGNAKVASGDSGNGAAEFFMLLGESYWEQYKEKKRKEKIEKEWLERIEKQKKKK